MNEPQENEAIDNVFELEDVETEKTDTAENMEISEHLEVQAEGSEELQPDCTEETTPEAHIAELEASICDLKEKIHELEEKNKAQNRVLEEVGAFTDLFPEVSIDSIPDCVWDEVKSGSSLPAAYALYEKRREAELYRISLINSENAVRSAGKAGNGTASEYFSPDEVRKMSPAQVHANYKKIKESMKKWM